MTYFTDAELKCRCGCAQNKFDTGFLGLLNEIRGQFGKPMIVTSAYRCEKHPIEARKQSPGPHNTGKAIDIGVYGSDAHELLEIAFRSGIEGIGVNQKGDIDQRFIHLDICNPRPTGPRPHIWSY